ncbi:MAG: hypothetical protein U9R51_04120 [Actinomycetota bacterium]|nr:hypothetical protein [Actinomycetota bacterium]
MSDERREVAEALQQLVTPPTATVSTFPSRTVVCRRFSFSRAFSAHSHLGNAVTPVGLAFKIPDEVREALMQRG